MKCECEHKRHYPENNDSNPIHENGAEVEEISRTIAVFSKPFNRTFKLCYDCDVFCTPDIIANKAG